MAHIHWQRRSKPKICLRERFRYGSAGGRERRLCRNSIRLCVDSIRKNIPQEKAVVRLITFENYREYVTFTNTIIQKYNDGKISMTHLSDILRAELTSIVTVECGLMRHII